MNFHRFHKGNKPQFMIIPLIDVIFFLLVFFMMNSMQTVTQRALSLQLPPIQRLLWCCKLTKPRLTGRWWPSWIC